MLDDFFIRALVAGVGLAVVVGPLGCFVVWRRMAYFGDTMAHSALLGIGLAFLLDISLIAGVFAVAVGVALSLMVLQGRNALPADALLGILSHSTLALGLVIVALMTWVKVDLMAYLIGDILAVTKTDIAVIYGGGLIVLLALAAIWKPLLTATVSPEIARAEGLMPQRSKLLFMLIMATVIAMAMKLVGILLITALLIIPAATARRFASSPEQMAVLASVIGAAAAAAGLFGSLQFDTPSGPSVVVAALVIFLFSQMQAVFARPTRHNTDGAIP